VGKAAFGIQFHPEVTHAMICRWTVRGAARLEMPGAQPRQAHLDGWFQHDAALGRWLGAFLDHWLGLSARERD
jgi:GMP synthase (glutamine-hydrolysing)